MSLVYNNLVFPRCHRTKKPHKYVLKTREKKLLLQLDSSYCLIPNLKRERKICCRLSTSSFKREIRKLHVVVHIKDLRVSHRCKVIGLLTKSTGFFLCFRCILNSQFTLVLSDSWGGGGGSFVSPFY